jgi:hypothetical protein
MRKYIASILFTLLTVVALAQTTPTFNNIKLGSDSVTGLSNGRVWYNPTSNKFRFRQNGASVSLGSGSVGSSTFTGLTDGPGSFSGKTLNYFRVNAGETALEYRTPSQVRSDIGAQATITFGTGVQTALGVNVGSAGAPVLFNGAGGTPSSMTGTNITGIVGSNVTNTAAGNISATNVQSAINELDGEKLDGVLTLSSITAATTLTGSDFGKTFLLTGTSADYTVDLPTASGNTGRSIAFKGSSALTKIVTIDPNGSEVIDGLSTRLIGASGMFVLISNGTSWDVYNEIPSNIPWVPTVVGSSASVANCYYTLQGKRLYINVIISGTGSGTALTFSMPPNMVPGISAQAPVRASNNATGVFGFADIIIGNSTVICYASPSGGAWSGAGTRGIYLNVALSIQ